MTTRLLRLKEVLHLCGLSRSQVYALIKIGKFPSPIKLGRSSAWLESELDCWAKACITASRCGGAHG